MLEPTDPVKNLILVRHAKSSWGDPSLDDHARPLNARGERVAPLMGEALAARASRPDVVLSSTALRARTTAGIIAAALGCADTDIIDEGRIYLASTPRLLQVLRDIDESQVSAMLFGHVPGVHDLANALCPDASIGHFPTCAIAMIQLEIEHWGAIDTGCGKLVDFLIPKEILPEA